MKSETGAALLEFLLSDSRAVNPMPACTCPHTGSGLADTAADITIIGGLFKKVTSVARLKKRDFKPADKTSRTYDQKSFKVDGRMDLYISFGDITMRTPVHIKLDAADQLLLSKSVCRQLSSVT